MGQEYEVSSIVIHNRPDCCEYQNGYALVELYNDNGEVMHLYSLGDTTGVANHTFDASDVPPTIPVKSIRIQQDYPAKYATAGTSLAFSEVQVFDASGANVALLQGNTVLQSSDYPSGSSGSYSYGPADYAVDGDLYTFNHVDVTNNTVCAREDTNLLSVV